MTDHFSGLRFISGFAGTGSGGFSSIDETDEHNIGHTVTTVPVLSSFALNSYREEVPTSTSAVLTSNSSVFHLQVSNSASGLVGGDGRSGSTLLNLASASSLSLTHEELVEEASMTVRKTFDVMEKEWYPAYHMAPQAGWMSVPGGLCFHNRHYHVFYQHHPYSENWGPMHWGHLTSEDLINWTHQPVALAPGAEEFDRDGCFSGSCVSHEGKLYAFYTGHRWEDSTLDNDVGIRQVQCLAVSTDGTHFEKLGIILEPPPGFIHFRDPKVWFQEGRWWLVCGARETAKDLGQLLLFTSEDLEHWDSSDYIVASRARDKNVFMWECPDLFPMDGKFVLIFCPQGMKAEGHRYRNRFQSGYRIGHFSEKGLFISESNFKELDRGHDFYAPQTFVAPDGRRVLIGWLDIWESPMPTKDHGWSGSLTVPRELILDQEQGRVYMVPVRELKQLRIEETHVSIAAQDLPENAEFPLVEDCTSHELEITFRLHDSAAEKYGLWLGRGLELYVDAQSDQIVLYRHYPDHVISGYRSCPLPDSSTLKLHVFIDRSSIEVFVNDGEETFSSRIYPTYGDRVLRVFAVNGNAQVLGGDVWQLKESITPMMVSPTTRKERC